MFTSMTFFSIFSSIRVYIFFEAKHCDQVNVEVELDCMDEEDAGQNSSLHGVNGELYNVHGVRIDKNSFM